ncbi:hypothetical protein [Agaribacter marinus]|uniref:Uncharacterized protein n=1 Tax=Agaribacter marinus TaxID=1431249 RepID=A0AA37SVM8_9ALTE|nr:hypothetical protein [Agaribacter marinus]GLR69997.1 hypothetical protein GCM10007852_09050 [Agaribacter marinus]
MIDPTKLNNQVAQKTVNKAKKKQTSKVNKTQSTVKNTQTPNKLVDRILASIDTHKDMSDEAKRKQYIVKTLESILGEKASGTPAFKQLMAKIEFALSVGR